MKQAIGHSTTKLSKKLTSKRTGLTRQARQYMSVYNRYLPFHRSSPPLPEYAGAIF